MQQTHLNRLRLLSIGRRSRNFHREIAIPSLESKRELNKKFGVCKDARVNKIARA